MSLNDPNILLITQTKTQCHLWWLTTAAPACNTLLCSIKRGHFPLLFSMATVNTLIWVATSYLDSQCSGGGAFQGHVPPPFFPKPTHLSQVMFADGYDLNNSLHLQFFPLSCFFVIHLHAATRSFFLNEAFRHLKPLPRSRGPFQPSWPWPVFVNCKRPQRCVCHLWYCLYHSPLSPPLRKCKQNLTPFSTSFLPCNSHDNIHGHARTCGSLYTPELPDTPAFSIITFSVHLHLTRDFQILFF